MKLSSASPELARDDISEAPLPWLAPRYELPQGHSSFPMSTIALHPQVPFLCTSVFTARPTLLH